MLVVFCATGTFHGTAACLLLPPCCLFAPATRRRGVARGCTVAPTARPDARLPGLKSSPHAAAAAVQAIEREGALDKLRTKQFAADRLFFQQVRPVALLLVWSLPLFFVLFPLVLGLLPRGQLPGMDTRCGQPVRHAAGTAFLAPSPPTAAAQPHQLLHPSPPTSRSSQPCVLAR